MAKPRSILDRPKYLQRTLGLVLDGLSDAKVAAALAEQRIVVTRQAITAFRKRHADELGAATAQLQERVVDLVLQVKEARLRDAEADYNRLGAVLVARAGDKRYKEPGYDTGTMVHSFKMVGQGENAVLVDECKVDIAVLAERRNIRHEIAEELGQLPKSDVTINDNRNQVLMREIIVVNGQLAPLG